MAYGFNDDKSKENLDWIYAGKWGHPNTFIDIPSDYKEVKFVVGVVGSSVTTNHLWEQTFTKEEIEELIPSGKAFYFEMGVSADGLIGGNMGRRIIVVPFFNTSNNKAGLSNVYVIGHNETVENSILQYGVMIAYYR